MSSLFSSRTGRQGGLFVVEIVVTPQTGSRSARLCQFSPSTPKKAKYIVHTLVPLGGPRVNFPASTRFP